MNFVQLLNQWEGSSADYEGVELSKGDGVRVQGVYGVLRRCVCGGEGVSTGDGQLSMEFYGILFNFLDRRLNG